jgi:hypothetical protein
MRGVNGYANPDRPDQRLSDDEREAAVGHLATAHAEGRLTAAEYQERASAARTAVTRGELAPLFTDLPEPASAPVSRYEGTTPTESGSSRALGGPVGATIMALTPFLALGLFFLFGILYGFTWSWLWFLIIPVAGIIIYGPGPAGSRALGGRTGAWIMALTPFLAVGLLLVFGFLYGFAWSWLWLLIIPVAGIIIYGPGSEARREQR